MARRSRGTEVPILVCLLVLLVAPRPASAQNRKLDRALNTFVSSGRSEDIPVIVTAAPGGRIAIVGKHVINLSLGHPVYESAATDPLVRAVEREVRAGILVVVSAGNYGVNPETDLPGYIWAPDPCSGSR